MNISLKLLPVLRAEPAHLRTGNRPSRMLRLSFDNLQEGKIIEITYGKTGKGFYIPAYGNRFIIVKEKSTEKQL